MHRSCPWIVLLLALSVGCAESDESSAPGPADAQAVEDDDAGPRPDGQHVEAYADAHTAVQPDAVALDAEDVMGDDAGAPDADAGAPTEHVVLFIGNSYTFGNDLPQMYRRVVSSLPDAPESVTVDSVTAGGRRLVEHAQDAATESHRLNQVLSVDGPAWTHVVLQEQSQIPGFSDGQPDYDASLDAMGVLATRIAPLGATVVPFMTWGRRTGDVLNPDLYPDYPTMQNRLAAGYRALAAHAAAAGATVTIAPVGLAFSEIYDEGGAEPLDPAGLFWRLYVNDGSHPSPLGTYLAACVFAAVNLGIDPEAVTFVPDGIDAQDALRLRAAARRATR